MISVEKWAGLVTNASPYALPPGAAVTQVNLQVLSPGQITLRPGTVSVSFSTHSGGSDAIVRMIRIPGHVEGVLYQNEAGEVRVARGPT